MCHINEKTVENKLTLYMYIMSTEKNVTEKYLLYSAYKYSQAFFSDHLY
jgi:hypothetical protein